MDIKLLKELKKVTCQYKAISKNEISYTFEDIKRKIDELAANIFAMKVEKITGSITYHHQCNLIKSIKSLGQIILLLINEQQKNINATNKALKSKDDSMYFKAKQDLKIDNIVIPENNDLNKKIDLLINKRKMVYTKSFGHFKLESEAIVIINKEFEDVNNWLDMLLKINNLKYTYFDNYDPLINGCQNLMYELMQLVIVLIRAEESRIARTISNPNIEHINSYFFMMDFVNSRSFYPDKLNLLIDNINRLNELINIDSNIGLLCKMRVCKQDEIQGIFVGDLEKFKKILEQELICNVRCAFGKFNICAKEKGILNIEDSIYDSPFDLLGKVTWSTRETLNNNPTLIKVKKPVPSI